MCWPALYAGAGGSSLSSCQARSEAHVKRGGVSVHGPCMGSPIMRQLGGYSLPAGQSGRVETCGARWKLHRSARSSHNSSSAACCPRYVRGNDLSGVAVHSVRCHLRCAATATTHVRKGWGLFQLEFGVSLAHSASCQLNPVFCFTRHPRVRRLNHRLLVRLLLPFSLL
jgi:hypothetical protein